MFVTFEPKSALVVQKQLFEVKRLEFSFDNKKKQKKNNAVYLYCEDIQFDVTIIVIILQLSFGVVVLV